MGLLQDAAGIIEKARKLIANPGAYTKATSHGAAQYVKNLRFDRETGEVADGLKLELDLDAIAEAERYDGYCLIVTSETGWDDGKVIDAYRVIERDWVAIDAAAENLGRFCILTGELDAEPAEVLAAYRKKDEVEKAFDEVENHLDMHRLRTRRQEAADGKAFCAFVALIARMRIENALGGWMRENRMAMERVMREFAKVRCVQGAGGKRLLNPLTKKQREIVGLMGFAEGDVRAFVERGGDQPV